ncbi:hypothetical protein AAG906_034350 [Vitis piasezkii]
MPNPTVEEKVAERPPEIWTGEVWNIDKHLLLRCPWHYSSFQILQVLGLLEQGSGVLKKQTLFQKELYQAPCCKTGFMCFKQRTKLALSSTSPPSTCKWLLEDLGQFELTIALWMLFPSHGQKQSLIFSLVIGFTHLLGC